jgi:hypothetical protein
MSNARDGDHTAGILFAAAVIVATLMAFVTTFERVNISSDDFRWLVPRG